MTIRELASKIASKEGKKSQARICDIREILAILSDILVQHEGCCMDYQILDMLFVNGMNRAKRRKKPLKSMAK